MTDTGKSAFINKINGKIPEDDGFAPQGKGNTTKEPTEYKHKENIICWDLPGVGTDLFPKESYEQDVKLDNYDFFFIFFRPVIQDTDIWLAKKLIELDKPFCFVRSKIDEDIESAEFDGGKPENVIEETRNKVLECLERNKELRCCVDIFFISSRKPELGQMNELLSFMETRLSSGKHEVILFTLPLLTKHLIEEKYTKLKNRLYLVTAGASAVSAAPVPILDVALNLGIIYNEIQHYIDVFDLGKERIQKLKDFDKRKLKWGYVSDYTDAIKLITSGVAPLIGSASLLLADSFLDILVPIVGSIISATTTAAVVFSYLSGVLNTIRDDAIVVFEHENKRKKKNI